MIGVNTGLIFGNYSYGSGLGLKIAETPLMIGINWVLLVYCTSAITETTKWKSWITVPLAASILLIYDMILEQVAPSMDMWSWSESVIPMQNYLAWWIIAFIMHVLVKLFDFRFQNKIALPVLLIQFIFFAVIVILL
jgi:putative membrane protein